MKPAMSDKLIAVLKALWYFLVACYYDLAYEFIVKIAY
jgi:hypothetical protein